MGRLVQEGRVAENGIHLQIVKWNLSLMVQNSNQNMGHCINLEAITKH